MLAKYRFINKWGNSMSTLEFLNQLSQKLNTGNLRSIHLNALPGRFATRLDISQLETIKCGLSSQFLFEHLLSRPSFSFRISYSDIDLNLLGEDPKRLLYLVARKLNSIEYENEDSYLEHGIKSFGFGYPLLIKRDRNDPKRIIKAPVFIWSLDIQKSPRVQNEWIIHREEDYGISVNELLISYLAGNANINLERLSDDLLNRGIIEKFDLLQITEQLLSQLNTRVDKSKFNADLIPCPSRDAIENISSSKPWICWSGVLGLYRTQKQSIIKDIEHIANNYNSFEFDNLLVERFQTSTISSVETDPNQEQIINSLTKSRTKIIQGPPGTGKSQSITAIITNALASKAKCLIVCEKKTALDVIYNNLFQLGLGDLCIVIDDINKDRKKVIDRARTIIEGRNNNAFEFREIEFRELNSEYENCKAELNKKHSAVLQKVLGDDTWKDIIGRYLNAEKMHHNDLLVENIGYDSFDFTHQEYANLSKLIKEGHFLFKPIKALNHPLNFLSDDIFNEEYSNRLKNTIADDILKRSKLSAAILREINVCSKRLGAPFYNNDIISKICLSLFSVFSKRHKFAGLKKAQIDYWLKQLKDLHFGNRFLKLDFPCINNKYSYIDISKGITSYHNNLTDICHSFELFQDFFNWKHFYKSLTHDEQKLILALIDANISDWQTAFESFYFNGVLLKNESKLGPFLQNDRLLEKMASYKEQLQSKHTNKILSIWRENQVNSLNNFRTTKGNPKILYNYRKNSQHNRRNSLRKIISTDFNVFTDFFPVVLANPVVCSSILPMEEGLFELVIFDEASQLRLEDTYSALMRGKFRTISGDKHQMPPSNLFVGDGLVLPTNDADESDDNWEDGLADSKSLLEYASNLDISQSFLDFHYRSKHPFLIDFSNAAFYGSRLVPMPPSKEYRPIRLVEVGGLYSNRTNISEAKKISDFLLKIVKPSPDGTFPSIGIATLNIEQRNLILDEILRHCADSESYAKKFEAIQKSGFFVKNLENIQGDEKDIIIMSTTFGFDRNGKFNERFGPLNIYEKGYKLLNVIITRAKHYLIVFTSIPKSYYSKYVDEIKSKGNLGKGIFYAYLAYADAIEKGDEEKRKNILRLLADHCAEPQPSDNNGFVESPFEQEVYDYLMDHFDKKRIQIQYKCGGFRIDFVIKPRDNSKPIIALECDGAKYHSSEEAYAYDLYRQNQLENFGFKVYRIWSTNWWENPEKEIQKLLTFVQKVQGQGNRVEISKKNEQEKPSGNAKLQNSQSTNTGLSLFIASTGRNKFHKPDCEWASYFIGSKRMLKFESREKAIDAGLKPCGACCP